MFITYAIGPTVLISIFIHGFHYDFHHCSLYLNSTLLLLSSSFIPPILTSHFFIRQASMAVTLYSLYVKTFFSYLHHLYITEC